jgi:hypothetical protein
MLASLAGYSLANAASDSETQTINLIVTSTITLTLGESVVNLGTLVPGTPQTATTSLAVTTNDYAGWNLQVRRDDATSTINLNGTSTPDVTFPDATEWTYSTPNGNTSPGANLSFRVQQTGTDGALYSSGLWGANDTDGTALYAGFPTTNQRIAGIASYVGAAQNVVYKFRADAPGTQQSGTYSGTITFTAITNP